jgi:glycosyltransferase involved in cell wall biosynthesis
LFFKATNATITPMISAVVPVFNEEESVDAFFIELTKELRKLGHSFEVIFVDDGSNDNTLSLLKKIESKNKFVRIFSFQRNHGKAEALTYGFQKAKGDLIVTLDADLQDRPSEIKNLLAKQKEGYDVVSGWRKNRKDSLAKILFSKMFNFLSATFWGVRLHDYNCGLKLYTASSAKCLDLYGGMHRFIPLLVADAGFKVTEIPVVHDVRKFGKSKYNAIKVLTQMPDMMTMLFISKYGKRPLHFFGFVGAILFGIGVLFGIYLSLLHFQGHSIGDRPLLLLSLLLMILGVQIAFTGLVADFILHTSRGNGSSPSILLRYSSRA